MKPIRKEYPPIRAYRKHGITYFRVDLRRKHHVGAKSKQFTDKTAAISFANATATQVAKQGLNSIATNGTDARIAVWNEQLSKYGKTVEDAMQLALKHYAGEQIKAETPLIETLLPLWVTDKTTNPLKPLREDSTKSIKNMSANFTKDFGKKRIAEIDYKFVDEYLKGKNVSNQTRKNINSYLSQFFNWCIHKDHFTGKNPCDKVEIHIEQGVPEFYTIEQCQDILKRVKGEANLYPYVALCLFAGIRPKEVQRMTWENINMETKEITIYANKAKTKKSRLFVMDEVLVEWLKLADKTKPLILPNLRNSLVKAMKDFNWIGDGLRHTFCTYHYAKHQKMEALRHAMGNSPTVIDKFYKGVISSTEVEKFWTMTPSTINN